MVPRLPFAWASPEDVKRRPLHLNGLPSSAGAARRTRGASPSTGCPFTAAHSPSLRSARARLLPFTVGRTTVATLRELTAQPSLALTPRPFGHFRSCRRRRVHSGRLRFRGEPFALPRSVPAQTPPPSPSAPSSGLTRTLARGRSPQILNIVPYVRKFGKHPVTGEPLELKQLIKLKFHK